MSGYCRLFFPCCCLDGGCGKHHKSRALKSLYQLVSVFFFSFCVLLFVLKDNLDLVDLPLSYTELYGLAKSPHASAAAAEGAATGHETDPAVCLVCGQVSCLLFVVAG